MEDLSGFLRAMSNPTLLLTKDFLSLKWSYRGPTSVDVQLVYRRERGEYNYTKLSMQEFSLFYELRIRIL